MVAIDPEDPGRVRQAGWLALRRWLWLAGQPVEVRRGARARFPSVRGEADDATVAQMYWIGELARGDGDIEVWLDRVFEDVMRRGGRAAMQSRADAARWRGDEAARSRWVARLGERASKVRDDRTAALARIAGW
jgi:hypothetical protein